MHVPFNRAIGISMGIVMIGCAFVLIQQHVQLKKYARDSQSICKEALRRAQNHSSLQCGIRQLLNVAGVALMFDAETCEQPFTMVTSKIVLHICASANTTKDMAHLRLYAALVGPEIIPLAFRLDETRSMFIASFTPTLRGNYTVDVSLMLLEPDDPELFVDLHTPIVTYFNGYGSHHPSLQCIEASRIYGSLQTLVVKQGIRSKEINNTGRCSLRQITDGAWRSHDDENHILNDDDGTNFNWLWQPRNCSVNYNVRELNQCLRNKHERILLMGDSQMLNTRTVLHYLLRHEVSPIPVVFEPVYLTSGPEFQMLWDKTVQTRSFTAIFANMGFTHEVYHQRDFSATIQDILTVATRTPADMLTYFMPLYAYAGYREHTITPSRLLRANALSKHLLNSTNWQWVDTISATDARWEASRDGLHFWGYCQNTMDPLHSAAITRRGTHMIPHVVNGADNRNECGGVQKALGIMILNILCYST